MKPKVDPPSATVHGGSDDSYGVFSGGWGSTSTYVPQQGVDYPPSPFWWNAAHKVVVAPDGSTFALDDPAMWSAYRELLVGPGAGDDETDTGDETDTDDETDDETDPGPTPPVVPPKPPIVHTPDPVEKIPETVPSVDPVTGTGGVHHTAPNTGPAPALPAYMQSQHRDRHFQPSSAPMHLPPPHVKVL